MSRIEFHSFIVKAKDAGSDFVTIPLELAEYVECDLRSEFLRRHEAETRANMKWGMRRELEELLGFADGETYDEEKFKKALDKVRVALQTKGLKVG